MSKIDWADYVANPAAFVFGPVGNLLGAAAGAYGFTIFTKRAIARYKASKPIRPMLITLMGINLIAIFNQGAEFVYIHSGWLTGPLIARNWSYALSFLCLHMLQIEILRAFNGGLRLISFLQGRRLDRMRIVATILHFLMMSTTYLEGAVLPYDYPKKIIGTSVSALFAFYVAIFGVTQNVLIIRSIQNNSLDKKHALKTTIRVGVKSSMHLPRITGGSSNSSSAQKSSKSIASRGGTEGRSNHKITMSGTLPADSPSLPEPTQPPPQVSSPTTIHQPSSDDWADEVAQELFEQQVQNRSKQSQLDEPDGIQQLKQPEDQQDATVTAHTSERTQLHRRAAPLLSFQIDLKLWIYILLVLDFFAIVIFVLGYAVTGPKGSFIFKVSYVLQQLSFGIIGVHVAAETIVFDTIARTFSKAMMQTPSVGDGSGADTLAQDATLNSRQGRT